MQIEVIVLSWLCLPALHVALHVAMHVDMHVAMHVAMHVTLHAAQFMLLCYQSRSQWVKKFWHMNMMNKEA